MVSLLYFNIPFYKLYHTTDTINIANDYLISHCHLIL